jgi:hypothetical protein
MLFRTAILTCVCALVLSSNAQSPGNTTIQTKCPAGAVCTNFNPADRYPTLSTRPQSGTWQIEDFKPIDASITCSVVKYDVDDLMPVLHLLCPGPQVFAPLRVHLTLTWKSATEVPEEIKRMLVDRSSNSLVKFKSRPGESKVELTLHDAADTQSLKEWVRFTKVQVGLVVPPDR